MGVGKDDVQLFGNEQRALSMVRTARLNCKTTVEVFTELWQEGIGTVLV